MFKLRHVQSLCGIFFFLCAAAMKFKTNKNNFLQSSEAADGVETHHRCMLALSLFLSGVTAATTQHNTTPHLISANS